MVGGGLIRSQGGWSAVNALRRLGVREKSDERILGSGKFVEQLIQQSDPARKSSFLRISAWNVLFHIFTESVKKRMSVSKR